jgi:hypothetical protein
MHAQLLDDALFRRGGADTSTLPRWLTSAGLMQP